MRFDTLPLKAILSPKTLVWCEEFRHSVTWFWSQIDGDLSHWRGFRALSESRGSGRALRSKPSIASTVYKLALAGEQAGFTVEQMIGMLNTGIGVRAFWPFFKVRLALRQWQEMQMGFW